MRKTCLRPGTALLTLVLAANLGAALPGDLNTVFQGIPVLFDGDWAFGVVEFDTGEKKTYNAEDRFQMEIPHLPLAALGVELSNAGDIPLDELIARDTFFWERLHYAQQGGRGMCMALIWTMGEGRINEWLQANGYTGTEINGVFQDYPECPVYDPNLISAGDALRFLQVIHENMGQSSVRKIGNNPPFSDHIRQTLGFDNEVYGWMDVSDGSKHLFLIVDRPDATDLGIVILAAGLDDRGDVDRGFRMLYEGLTE